jgi:nitric-oxide synthase
VIATQCPVAHTKLPDVQAGPGLTGSDKTAATSSPAATTKEAVAFLKQLRSEWGERGCTKRRLAEVRAEIAATGSYRHTAEELTRGCKIAWRNTPRCLGKFYWNALATRDMRHLAIADEVFEALVEHLRLAANGGRVKLLITVFAPDGDGQPPFRIWNSQLVSYAGYRQPDGSIVGDPASAVFTEAVQALGWTGPGTPFDVLPVVLQGSGQPPKLYQLPQDVVLEVPISHPDLPRLADLGLRWYAFPSICNQRLEIGGISYSLAPFSGWYTAAEIGARNLSDATRYNLLPVVAERMGLDTSSDRTLWKDRAMLELTIAVMHSFDTAGVSIIDHHFASRQFVKHELREQSHSRPTPGHWELLVPPTGGSATPLWERRYQPTILRPNFFAQPPPFFVHS